LFLFLSVQVSVQVGNEGEAEREELKEGRRRFRLEQERVEKKYIGIGRCPRLLEYNTLTILYFSSTYSTL
jgi:hypothetical protein